MPIFELETPQGTFEVEAPDQETALRAIRPQLEQPSAAGDVAKSSVSGLAKGTAGLLGTPGIIRAMSAAGGAGSRLGRSVMPEWMAPLFDIQEQVFGATESAAEVVNPSAGRIEQALAKTTKGATAHKPGTTAGKYAETIASFVPGALLFGGLTGGAQGAVSSLPRFAVAPGVASEAAGQLTEGTALEGPARAGAAIAAPIVAGGFSNLLRQYRADRAARKAVPSIQELKDSAGGLYRAAEKSAVEATAGETQAIRDELFNIARTEGAITSKGTVADIPKLKHALTFFEDAAGSVMTVKDMRIARKTLVTLAASGDPSEARLGSMLLKRFDNFTGTYAPQIREANALYHAAKNAEKIAERLALAESDAAASQSVSFANAVRTRFKQLEQTIIKGDEVGFSEAERNAIQAVAQGNISANALRQISKFSPTSLLGLLSAFGAGAAGGPVLGGGIAAVGAAARAGGEALAQRTGANAERFMRAGGPVRGVVEHPSLIDPRIAGPATTTLGDLLGRKRSNVQPERRKKSVNRAIAQ